MLRLLGVLALATSAAIGILVIVMPDALSSWIDVGQHAVLLALAAAGTGVSLTALVVAGYYRFRIGSVVNAAERIAGGDFSAPVPTGGHGLEGRLGRAVRDIGDALANTRQDATYDRLTGVANRQTLLAALFAEVERASRYDRPLSVAFVDIDHFKTVNDTYGHAIGDVVLRGVAQTIAANLRASDLIGRYGGEEFMLILTETGVEEGAALTEKLRTLVQTQRYAIEGNPDLTVTISIGLAGGTGQQLRMEALVRDADAAMYSAKSLGRNQVYIFEEPDDDARVPRAPISPAGRARAVEIGQRARDAATVALAEVLNPLPHYRGQPSALIASIVVDLAQQLQLSQVETDRLRVAALLHDVGKVAVPREILDKPAALTSSEWQAVVQHPRIGQVILEQAAALKDAVPIILHHHERYAGHGYPYGLRANEIPLGARIVAIADAYDAMVNDRPYKRAMSHEQAIAELRRHAGTQFDPDLVTLFCDLYGSRAPAPDPTVLAMTTASHVHAAETMAAAGGAGGIGSSGAVITSGLPKRRRRTDSGADQSVGGHRSSTDPDDGTTTMAADGALGIGPRPVASTAPAGGEGTPARVSARRAKSGDTVARSAPPPDARGGSVAG